jgi:hypothetical protein
MSWKLRKPGVDLRIARFLPEIAPAQPAGLTDEQRAAHRAKREQECAKVEPAAVMIQEVFKDFNIFMYGNFVEVVPIEPCPEDCACELCAGIRARLARKRPPYDELYLKQKRMREL